MGQENNAKIIIHKKAKMQTKKNKIKTVSTFDKLWSSQLKTDKDFVKKYLTLK